MTTVRLENSNTAEINSFLGNASLYVGYTGVRYALNQNSYIELDQIIERLKHISSNIQAPADRDNLRNGIESVHKIRKLYSRSDLSPCAIIRNIFEGIIYCSQRIYWVATLFTNNPYTPPYSPRSSIDVDPEAIYSIGPANIEQDFRYALNLSSR